MKPVMRWWPIGLVIVVVTGAGCSKATSTMRSLAGLDPKDDPSVTLKRYIWVEEDKVPLTVKTLVFGKGSIIAPPEIVAKYSSPPGGGKISPRQGGPYQVAGSQPRASASPPAGPAAAPAPTVLQGYVVFVDTTRIVIDLTGRDGIRPGSRLDRRSRSRTAWS